jgi:hypothetical protein
VAGSRATKGSLLIVLGLILLLLGLVVGGLYVLLVIDVILLVVGLCWQCSAAQAVRPVDASTGTEGGPTKRIGTTFLIVGLVIGATTGGNGVTTAALRHDLPRLAPSPYR